MPLTSAEKVRRYRERLKNNPLKQEEVRKKNLERINKNAKKISQLSESEKNERREIWRKQKSNQRKVKKEKIKDQNTSTVSLQNDNNTNKSEVRQKTQIKQLKNKTIILKKNIDAKRRQIEALRKKVYRLQQTEREHINLKQSIRSTYIQCKNLKEKTLIKNFLLQSNMKYKSTVLGLTGKIRTKLQNHRGNKNVDCIKRFFLRDDISRATSGKKECKTKNKKKKQIRYLVDTLQKLYVTYVREGGRVSFTTFTRYKPFYVLSPSVRNRNTCLCVKHSNMQFMAHALKRGTFLILKVLLI